MSNASDGLRQPSSRRGIEGSSGEKSKGVENG